MKHFNKHSKTAWLAISLLALTLSGCGGSSSQASGSVRVALTDAPACGFDAVNVTIKKLRIHQSSSASENGSGWTDITLNPPQKINLLDLNNGVIEDLGEVPLAAGHYTQLRLVLDKNTSNIANTVVPTGGVETPLDTPSAVQSGIKLIHEFDVASGQRTDLALDFDACKSIVKRGNGTYGLKPVIKVIPYALNGIDGFVDTTLLGSNTMVTAQQNGEVVRSTAPKATGEFFLTRLPAGNYDVVVTADGHATAIIANVLVENSTSVVNVSDSTNKITLPTSATHTVSGNVTLNPVSTTETAYVTAKQTLGASSVIAVKTVAADDASIPSGAYLMNLPTDAPRLGQYSTSLPITFTAQSGVGAHYTMEATANGYTPQSVSKDISAVDATQDFILIP